MKKILYVMLLFFGIIPISMCAADKASRAEKRDRDNAKKLEKLFKDAQKDELKNFDKEASSSPLSPKLTRKLPSTASISPTNLALAIAALDRQKAAKNDRLVTD